MRQGWDPRYKIWVEHGEPAPPTPPPVIDNTRQPLMSDMTALLNDLSYIPPNNEHNEPTQGDIVDGKTVTRRGESSYIDERLRYFPIIPRLQRLYKSSHTAKDMIWHATGKCTEPGKMQHPVDGGAWKKFDTKYPDFAKEPRNVRLGLAVMVSIRWQTLVRPTACGDQMFTMRGDGFYGHQYDFPARSSLSGGVGKKWLVRGQNKNGKLLEASEALEGGPIRPPGGCYPFESYVKKLKVMYEIKLSRKCNFPDNEMKEASSWLVWEADGQSIDVDAPPDIIDVVDEDDDIIDEEDPIPHDLVDSGG
ncbi:F-box domain containing protein [Tanacetum coccineum]